MPLFATLDRLKTDLDVLRPLAPEQEQRVLQKFRLDWNYNSNAIEGNSLTLGETRSLLLHGLTAAGKPMRDHLDVKGHNEAVLALEEFVRSEYPLTEQLIREMHQLLLGEAYHTPAQTAGGQPTRKLIVPGRYKTSPNNVLTVTGEMFYFASVEETPSRMMDLVDWYRAEEAAPTMHLVALAAEFHYRFVRIHPFDDGNGRMSRLLMNLILLRHGYPMTVIKATDRNRYLAALSAADAGDPEPFLRFVTENVEAGLHLMIRAARGESIDEPDDLDKKLALLKKQIMTQSDVLELVWNQGTKQEFPSTFLFYWINDLFKQLNRFDFAFLEKSYIVLTTINRQPFPDIVKLNSSESVTETLTIFFNDTDVFFEDLSLTIRWAFFKQASSSFDLNLTLDFEFNKTSFAASYTIDNSGEDHYKVVPPVEGSIYDMLLELPYKKSYDQVRIHEINYQLANKVYDFIAAKVAEADSSPS